MPLSPWHVEVVQLRMTSGTKHAPAQPQKNKHDTQHMGQAAKSKGPIRKHFGFPVEPCFTLTTRSAWLGN